MKKIIIILLVMLFVFTFPSFAQQEDFVLSNQEMKDILKYYSKEDLIEMMIMMIDENVELQIKQSERYIEGFINGYDAALKNTERMISDPNILPPYNPQLDELNYRLFMLQSTMMIYGHPGFYFPFWLWK